MFVATLSRERRATNRNNTTNENNTDDTNHVLSYLISYLILSYLIGNCCWTVVGPSPVTQIALILPTPTISTITTNTGYYQERYHDTTGGDGGGCWWCSWWWW